MHSFFLLRALHLIHTLGKGKCSAKPISAQCWSQSNSPAQQGACDVSTGTCTMHPSPPDKARCLQKPKTQQTSSASKCFHGELLPSNLALMELFVGATQRQTAGRSWPTPNLQVHRQETSPDNSWPLPRGTLLLARCRCLLPWSGAECQCIKILWVWLL